MSWQPSGSSQTQNQQSSFGSSIDDQSNRSGGRQNKPKEFPLYIVNIPVTLTENELEEMFSQAGEVAHSRCLPPKEGRNSCVGFITYKSQDEAEKAISMFNSIQIDNQTLRVDYTRSFKEGNNQRKDNAARPFGEQTNNNLSPPRNGYKQMPGQHQNNDLQTFTSIGRGIHYDNDSSNQPMSFGRTIVPVSEGILVNGYGQSNHSQPGISHTFSSGAPNDTSHDGYGNYQNYPPQDSQMYTNSAVQPPSMTNEQYTNDGSQTAMNGVINGLGSMHVAVPAEPAASNQSFGSTGNQPFGSTGNQSFSSPGNQPLGPGNQSSVNNSSPGQSFTTNLYQVSSRLPKAQNDLGSSNKTCNKCGEIGHFARECPSNSGVGQNSCHRCGEQGHFARECPNGPGDRGSGGSCHQCGQTGHFAKECPNRTTGVGQGDGCYKCGEQGHFARECPNSSGGNAGCSGGNCHQCGEIGHFARECPNQDSTCPRPAEKVDYVPPPIPDDIDLLFKASVHKGINFDRFDNIPVSVSGNNAPLAIQSFEEIALPDTLKSNVNRAEFTKPTPIQKHGIPIILSGRDIMGCAQTGSGKTLAFLLPVMVGMLNSRLPEASYLSGDAPSPAALCIAPTRELASQIYTEAIKFSSGTYLRPVVCYGGVSVQHQLDKLQRGCHILIGTPGRLIDFAGRNKVSLSNVRYLILDEGDRMLDMGFENDIRKIVNQFGIPEKTQRQTLMFSATFPDDIQKLAAEFLNDYIFVAVGSVGGTNLDIKQDILSIDGDKKRSVLMEILGQSGTDKTLVFVERKRNADFLASWLSQNNYPATSISGDRTQREREDALRDFRNGRATILIATSVAARGLDIPDVKHVVNYDLPQQIEEYVHRIGRTGRIGNQGKATAFFDKEKDDKLARSLVKVLFDALQDVPDWLEEVAERALGTSYGPAGGKFRSRDARQIGHGRSGGDHHSNSGGTRQQASTTNVSFTNQAFPQQISNNKQDDGDDDEAEWE